MNAALHACHGALGVAISLVVLPLKRLSPECALTVVSVVVGVALVWLFGKLSDQGRIRVIRNRIRGNLLAVRIYQHDARVVLQLQLDILRDTSRYVWKAFLPLALLTVPLVFLLAQLNLRFSVRPLQAGETAVVVAKFDRPEFVAAASLRAAGGVAVETAGVRILGAKEVAWRVRAEATGTHQLTLSVGKQDFSKEVVVGDQWGAVGRLRSSRWTDNLLYPGEAPLEDGSAISNLEIYYPPLSLEVLGVGVDWLVMFLLVSMLAGFALKGVLRVEI